MTKYLLKKIWAWILIAFGLLLLLSLPAFLPKVFAFITFALPGAWILLHARRESNGAEPMKRHWGIVGVLAVVSFFTAVATTPSSEATDNEPEKAAVTTSVETTTSKTSTTRPTSSSTTTSTTTSAPPTSTVEPTPTREPEPTTDSRTEVDQDDDDRAVGFIEVPRQPDPTPEVVKQTPVAPAPDPEVVEQAPAAPAVPSRGATCPQVGHKTYIGDGIYASNQDADGDGVGCEAYPG